MDRQEAEKTAAAAPKRQKKTEQKEIESKAKGDVMEVVEDKGNKKKRNNEGNNGSDKEMSKRRKMDRENKNGKHSDSDGAIGTWEKDPRSKRNDINTARTRFFQEMQEELGNGARE